MLFLNLLKFLVLVLVIIHNPKGIYYGGTIAAPIAPILGTSTKVKAALKAVDIARIIVFPCKIFFAFRIAVIVFCESSKVEAVSKTAPITNA